MQRLMRIPFVVIVSTALQSRCGRGHCYGESTERERIMSAGEICNQLTLVGRDSLPNNRPASPSRNIPPLHHAIPPVHLIQQPPN